MNTACSTTAETCADTLGKLSSIFGDRLKTGAGICEQYGKDESYHPSSPPDAVIQPRDVEEIQEIGRI